MVEYKYRNDEIKIRSVSVWLFFGDLKQLDCFIVSDADVRNAHIHKKTRHHLLILRSKRTDRIGKMFKVQCAHSLLIHSFVFSVNLSMNCEIRAYLLLLLFVLIY